jgi:hypothetical protein
MALRLASRSELKAKSIRNPFWRAFDCASSNLPAAQLGWDDDRQFPAFLKQLRYRRKVSGYRHMWVTRRLRRSKPLARNKRTITVHRPHAPGS